MRRTSGTARAPVSTRSTSRSDTSSDDGAPRGAGPVSRAVAGDGTGRGARLSHGTAGARFGLPEAREGRAQDPLPRRGAGAPRRGDVGRIGGGPRRALLRRRHRGPPGRLRLLRHAPGPHPPRDDSRPGRAGRNTETHRDPVVRRAETLPADEPLAPAVPGPVAPGSRRAPGHRDAHGRDPVLARRDPGCETDPDDSPPVRGAARRRGAGRAVRRAPVSGFERTIVHVTTWLMAITGAVYFFMKYLMTGSDPFSVLHHPWQPHALSLHVLTGPVAVFALGLIARDHILDRIFEPRQRRGRATGLIILALAAPMIASGYLMQVLTDPGARRILVGAHVISGALYTLLFAGHLIVSRAAGRGANGNGRGGSRLRGRTSTRHLDRPGRRGIGSLARRRAQVGPAGPEEVKP